ncbi:MAG: alpha/beta hydrolase-fold protein [Opitutus sp.]
MKPAFKLSSQGTGTEYHIYVATPKESSTPATPAESWRTILFMDGDDQFAAAVEAYQELRKADAVPPLLLVGVGYDASYMKPGNRRGRDYTPTFHSDEPSSGGAAAFLRFLQMELWPELARRYPVRADERGIGGHSLGSLLVLDALLQEPPFFSRFLASAPSIWWDNRSVLQLVGARHARNPRVDGRLYLSVGGKDSASMTSDLKLLEEDLSTSPFSGLTTVTQRFPKRNHFNVIPDAFRAGLKALYG